MTKRTVKLCGKGGRLIRIISVPQRAYESSTITALGYDWKSTTPGVFVNAAVGVTDNGKPKNLQRKKFLGIF